MEVLEDIKIYLRFWKHPKEVCIEEIMPEVPGWGHFCIGNLEMAFPFELVLNTEGKMKACLKSPKITQNNTKYFHLGLNEILVNEAMFLGLVCLVSNSKKHISFPV